MLDSNLSAEVAEEGGVISIVSAAQEVGAYLVSHPALVKVACTGSTAARGGLAEARGRVLRPVTLERGGKSTAVVLDDHVDQAKIGEGLCDFSTALRGFCNRWNLSAMWTASGAALQMVSAYALVRSRHTISAPGCCSSQTVNVQAVRSGSTSTTGPLPISIKAVP